MTVPSQPVVVAAGAVCWRNHRGKIRVLLVRRDSRSDTSLPKGKPDLDESLQEAAVREALEETGLVVGLGAPLGTTEYPLPGGRNKIVHYWAAEVDDKAVKRSTFTPSAEIDAVEWVSLDRARAKLSYERDREIIDRFALRVATNTHRTFGIIALRHGKAVPAGSWSGSDSTRPLQPIGLEQARAAAKSIAAYQPKKLISSTAARCVSTVEAVATTTGLDIKATAAISQDAHEEGTAQVARTIAKRFSKRVTTVLCSHGPVLPDVVEEIARLTGATTDYKLRRAGMLAVGGFSVVHLSTADPDSGIVAVEIHPSPIG